MNKAKQYRLLSYAGTLPFIVCAILTLVDLQALPLADSFTSIAATYALVIVSFMAGVHWGNYLVVTDKLPLNLFLSSNIIAIVVWLVFLSMGDKATLAIAVVAFVSLLLIDYKLCQAKVITPGYLEVRRNVTAIVIVSLLLTLIASEG